MSKTSQEVTAEMAEKKTELAALQAETDDERWRASQKRRNALEADIRELGQLHARIVQREAEQSEKERRAALVARLARAEEVRDQPNPHEMAFAGFLRSIPAALRSLKLARQFGEAKNEGQRIAMTTATELGREVNAFDVKNFLPTWQDLRAELFKGVVDAGDRELHAELLKLLMPEPVVYALADDPKWQQMVARDRGTPSKPAVGLPVSPLASAATSDDANSRAYDERHGLKSPEPLDEDDDKAAE